MSGGAPIPPATPARGDGICLPGRRASRRSLNQREPRFDLLARAIGIHGTMGAVTVAQPSPHIVLVARRHIDLKRVCSCICLP